MKYGFGLVLVGLVALPTMANAQSDPCSFLQNPEWVEWPTAGGVRGDGRLIQLDLDESGGADFVLLPSTLSGSIPYFMLDSERWMKGGDINLNEPVFDIAELHDSTARDSLLSVGPLGLASWELTPGSDHFERVSLSGPWSTVRSIRTSTEAGNPMGLMAILDDAGTSIYLQARMLQDLNSVMDLATLTLSLPAVDFALIDYFGMDGQPELVVLDAQNLTIYGLDGSTIVPAVSLPAGENALGKLTGSKRCCLPGSNIYFQSESAAGQSLVLLNRSAALSTIPMGSLQISSLAIDDYDANGMPDLTLCTGQGEIFMLINDPSIDDASFAQTDLILFDTLPTPSPILITDQDHDSDLDLIAGGRVYAGTQLNPIDILPLVNEFSLHFGIDKSKGPGASGLPLITILGTLGTTPLPRVGGGDGPRSPGALGAGAGAGGGGGGGHSALIGNVNRLAFSLDDLNFLPASVTEFELEIWAELMDANEKLVEVPVAKFTLPVATEIDVPITPLDDVLFHYITLRPLRVQAGKEVHAFPTISFRWSPQHGADDTYMKVHPPAPCAVASAAGRSGPVPVIPVTFLGSWPSYY